MKYIHGTIAFALLTVALFAAANIPYSEGNEHTMSIFVLTLSITGFAYAVLACIKAEEKERR